MKQNATFVTRQAPFFFFFFFTNVVKASTNTLVVDEGQEYGAYVSCLYTYLDIAIDGRDIVVQNRAQCTVSSTLHSLFCGFSATR